MLSSLACVLARVIVTKDDLRGQHLILMLPAQLQAMLVTCLWSLLLLCAMSAAASFRSSWVLNVAKLALPMLPSPCGWQALCSTLLRTT